MATLTVNAIDYEMQKGESVLGTLIRNGLKPAHSCRRGTCLTCLSRVIEGTVPERAQDVLLNTQKEKGLFLACVCYPDDNLEIQIKTQTVNKR